MKPASTSRRSPSQRGLTLIEITLVVVVLLGLIAVLFIGVAAYKKGTDRALCIQNISTTQKAVRSLANLYVLQPGDPIADLEDRLYGEGKFVPEVPACPRGGTYTWGGNEIPAVGVAYLDCDVDDHEPATTGGW
ncbi:MAG: hypothetical protein AAGC68_04500 [Verrucomicrobiota bacterium]